MKVRILINPDKSISVIHPAPKSKRENETEEQWLERVFNKATPEGVEFEDIDKSELPENREERVGWEKEKGKPITINKIKADKWKKDREDEFAVQEELKLMAKERLGIE